MNVASWAALMSNRSAAVSPATARLERWKMARMYAARATPHTTHARLTQRRYACDPGRPKRGLAPRPAYVAALRGMVLP